MTRIRLHAERLQLTVTPLDAFARLRDHHRPILLEGTAGRPRRHAWVFVDPYEITDDVPDLAALRRRLEASEFTGEGSGPFRGGFVGALAYDLGVEGEGLQLPRDPWDWPRVLGGLYSDFLYFDLVGGTVALVTGDGPQPTTRDQRRARLLAELSEGSVPAAGPMTCTTARRLTSSAEHIARVEQVREWIRGGEFYQANLSHRFECEFDGEPLDLYRTLRRVNPAPYMACFASEHGWILSSSPELLVESDGHTARSRPIKGTARRSDDPSADDAAAAALLASSKDRAELAMIVDLVRNDLGRVARAGGVAVEELAGLESYAHVHHLVATVAAELAAGTHPIDLVAALFPGGSITGAPKVRSMQAIAELECEGRGPFTGSLGFIGSDGNLCLNILIRTLLLAPRADGSHDVSFRVGGGITWRSDASAEDDETLDKARGLVAALCTRRTEGAH